MESLTEGIKYRKTTLKLVKITNKNPTTSISNHRDGGGVNHDDNDVDNHFMTVNGEEELLSPTSLLLRQPNLNMHLIVIMGLKNPIDPRVICEKLPHTLLKHYRFSSLQALADMMGKNTKAKWGNLIGYVFLPFTIGIKDDPIDYLRDAKATIDRKKFSFEALYTATIINLILKLFGIKASSMFTQKILNHTTLISSNMVGPIEEIEFYGHALEYIAPSVYGQPQGLLINLLSYSNKMRIVLSVDERTIPDPHKLLDDLEDSLKLIKEAVYAKRLVKDV